MTLYCPGGTNRAGLRMQWQSIDTVPEGEHVLLFFPNGEKGNGGIETATVFRDESPNGFSYWTHGGPNAGGDWETREAPTHWMRLPPAPKIEGH